MPVSKSPNGCTTFIFVETTAMATTHPLPPPSPPKTSPFLTPQTHSTASSLSILHLRRDQHLPIILQPASSPSDGYLEGPVTNTRFGSFPHSTLVNQPWGAQVRASEVDTGSRGRKGWEGKGKKRKRGQDATTAATELDTGIDKGAKEAPAIKTAATGFVHILPPTPELWTASLPHRTQVVYTPDYSYILHRLRVRPGSVIIEAGAGSGSFTHAAARAVFDGYPEQSTKDQGAQTEDIAEQKETRGGTRRKGKVYSFEFHEQRCAALKSEITEHGLDGIVELTHRDVCEEVFVPDSDTPIHADAIFLDLPAPWLALKHLTRRIRRKDPSSPPLPQQPPLETSSSSTAHSAPSTQTHFHASAPSQPPPPSHPLNPSLNPNTSIHICTFSPCIEQVTRTISTLRAHGWVDIAMVELSARKIEVRRERVGLQEEGLRGVNASPASVDEAVERLREVEGRTRWFHEQEGRKKEEMGDEDKEKYISKQARLSAIAAALPTRKLYKEGRLVTKSEPELKTHTSYLVFAILPREWNEEDEAEAQRVWGGRVESEEVGGKKPVSKRQRKKEAKRREGGNKGEVGEEGVDMDVEMEEMKEEVV